MARRKPAPERTCCDGLCQRQGGTCPAFAPGVLAGPFRAQASRRSRAAARLLLLMLAVVLALTWLGWH